MKTEDKNFINKIVNALILIILVIYLKGYFNIRYHNIIPTITIYPDNITEAKLVEELVNENNSYYIDLFKKTDDSVTNAFQEVVELSREKINDIVLSPHLIFITLFLKTLINRARPKQVINSLEIQKSKTANTPAYPSGHCIQAYYLAKKLSEMYPEKEDMLFKLAEDCALSRVYAGLHYHSDNEFGKYISLNIL